jgi:ABC-type sugar transport system permease subunit/ABC-type glycerol-3-phosphate transport system substrate-binding protein
MITCKIAPGSFRPEPPGCARLGKPMKILSILICVLTFWQIALPASADPPVKLMVWGMESTAESKDQDAEIAAFEKMHPNITVETLSMGSGGMDPQKLMTAIVGGVPPDVILQDRFTIGDWASRGAFTNLDKYIAADKKSSNNFAIRKDNFLPSPWAETMYHGHVYAIPKDTDDRVLFYNRRDFIRAGLNPDQPPQTWNELLYDTKKITTTNPDGSISRLGFDPTYAQGWLYIWSWQEDGDFMSPDGYKCTLDNPGTEKALSTIVSWFDDLGGVDTVNKFTGTFNNSTPENDPFLTGKLAMKVDGDAFINNIARYAPNLDFGIVPVPVPTERFEHTGVFKNDPTWVTWSGGFSLVIPRGAAHPSAAWQFIQWMTSPQAALIGAKAQKAYQLSKGRAYVPTFSANIQANKVVFAKYLPLLSPRLREAKQQCLDLLPLTKYRPVTFVGQLVWDQAAAATDSATRHDQTPARALADAQYRVQLQIDETLNTGAHPLVPIIPVAAAIGVIVLVGVIWLLVCYQKWRATQKIGARAEAIAGMMFISPWAFGFVILTLGPILASLVLSFCDYDVLHPARWAGISNYAALVTTDRVLAMKCLVNAVYLAVFSIPLGMAIGLAMALLLNTKIYGLKGYRTAFYIPSIVPTVATAVLWQWILSPDPHRGLINEAWLATLTHWFGIAPPGWLAVTMWSKPSLVLINLWGAGGGMILWLAGLQSIPATLYEAASLDGAGWWSQFRNVTLPMLSPYIFFNIIMGLIGALQTFDNAYILGGTGNGGGTTGPDNSLLVPVVYLFNTAFQYFKMGYASAIAWVLFIIVLGLTLGQLKMAPRWVHYEVESK